MNKNKADKGTRMLLGAHGVADALKKYGVDVVAKVLAEEFDSKIAVAKRTPTNCVLWENPERVKELPFERIKRYVDDGHFIRDLIKCPECGQLYFKEFVEEIDWVHGNDPQYRTYIPVRDESEADELNKLDMFEVLKRSPQLRCDWPSDGPQTIRWNK
jgi:hypothetical protein